MGLLIGLSQIKVGIGAPDGIMPTVMGKIGEVYKGTAKLSQDPADITEHFEEGKAIPTERSRDVKPPKLTFSLMNVDVQMLIDYVGGENVGSEGNPKWGFDGSEDVPRRSILIETKKGFSIEIPYADIEAVIKADLSSKGIFLIDFTVTPLLPTSGKAIRAVPKSTLEVAPTSLTFTSAADSTGKTITATSVGNLTSANVPSDVEWATVTRTGKVATVKVSANANSDARTTKLTITADGNTVYVPITQAGTAV